MGLFVFGLGIKMAGRLLFTPYKNGTNKVRNNKAFVIPGICYVTCIHVPLQSLDHGKVASIFRMEICILHNGFPLCILRVESVLPNQRDRGEPKLA